MANPTPNQIAGFLSKLQADEAELRAWIETGLADAASVTELAVVVRTMAGNLSRSQSDQDQSRQQSEEALRVKAEELDNASKALDDAPPSPDRDTYLQFASIRGGDQIWPSHFQRNPQETDRSSWTDEIRASDRWPEFDQTEREILRLRVEGVKERDEALEGARHAATQAGQVVSNAMSDSTQPRPEGWGPPETPAGRAAVAPFVAFLMVAAVGVQVEVTTTTSWTAIALLLAPVVVAVLIALKNEAQFGTSAALAAGAAFSIFTAAYLVCRLADPESLLRASGGQPVERIGEAAMTALTVGVTGGTLGIELGGAARVVAFIQILLTIALVASVVGYGWQRLSARPRAPEGEGSEGA